MRHPYPQETVHREEGREEGGLLEMEVTWVHGAIAQFQV